MISERDQNITNILNEHAAIISRLHGGDEPIQYAEKIVNEYSAIILAYSGPISCHAMPISTLKCEKATIKNAIKTYAIFSLWLKKLNSELLDQLEAKYLHLAFFVNESDAAIARIFAESFQTMKSLKSKNSDASFKVQEFSRFVKNAQPILKAITTDMKVLGKEFSDFKKDLAVLSSFMLNPVTHINLEQNKEK